MGQNTGMLNISKHVNNSENNTPLVKLCLHGVRKSTACQNNVNHSYLNSTHYDSMTRHSGWQETNYSKLWHHQKDYLLKTLPHVTYQNLNSGNLLINGLNSSVALVGSEGPSGNYSKLHTKYQITKSIPDSQSSSSNAGSIFGDKNKINKFKM